MDWILIGGILMAGWVMLSVLSGQRFGQAQQIAMNLAEKARAGQEEKGVNAE